MLEAESRPRWLPEAKRRVLCEQPPTTHDDAQRSQPLPIHGQPQLSVAAPTMAKGEGGQCLQIAAAAAATFGQAHRCRALGLCPALIILALLPWGIGASSKLLTSMDVSGDGRGGEGRGGWTGRR